MQDAIIAFRMPRYHEIPNVGLYLEQTIKYINQCLAPLEISITPSMLSNYVKLGYIKRPIKKQYYADQIASLLFAVLAKQVLSMGNIKAFFDLQAQTDPLEDTYAFFCNELEAMLRFIFGVGEQPPILRSDEAFEKRVLRSLVTAIAQVTYLNDCFKKSETAD